MKQTFQPNKRRRAKVQGFRNRSASVIKSRRHKGRVRLGIR